MKTVVLAAVFPILSAPAALAQQSFSNNGVGTATTSSTSVQIAEGHVLINTQSTYSNLATEDGNNPLNGATGPCFGAMEITAPAIRGSGYCVFTDAGGDMAVVAWTADTLGAEGATGGQWSLTGGSGKYDGANGSGRYDLATNAQTGEQTNTVTGEITLP